MDEENLAAKLSQIDTIVSLYDEEETAIRDCLADMMHWCVRKGIDFSEELAIAEGHYEAEKIDIAALA